MLKPTFSSSYGVSPDTQKQTLIAPYTTSTTTAPTANQTITKQEDYVTKSILNAKHSMSMVEIVFPAIQVICCLMGNVY